MAQVFKTLKGFRDFFPEDCATRNYVFDVWRRVAVRYGFQEYEGPVLEPTELYKRKSGNEIVGQLFCFEDKGGRDVSMRPELTPTLARMAAAKQRDYKKPLKWFSIGQFFRYERHQKGRGREFYQFNCDILGEESVAADAELIALSIDLMREFGFTSDDFSIRLSDRNAWTDFAAESGVGEDRMTDFLQVIDKLEREKPEVTEEKLDSLGLTLESIRDFIGGGAAASDRISAIQSDLDARGMGDFVQVDLSIVRGLAYYTGAVFEVFDIGKGMRAVAGGGRYDQLVKLIGNAEMPACGFAMGDMVITDLIRETAHANEKLEASISESGLDVFVVIADEEKRTDAIRLVQELRQNGLATGFPLTPAKVGKQFQNAEQAGAKFAVVVGTEFPETTVKKLADRSEFTCEATEIAGRLLA
ncbi:MAG: histidine--tRNA ligase [Verrucomicrobiales bacterium]|nr:histidine--tRNA ligase [Verrucomicrobiales bacterium]